MSTSITNGTTPELKGTRRLSSKGTRGDGRTATAVMNGSHHLSSNVSPQSIKASDVTEDMIEEEKKRLLAEKQTQLEIINDSHDSLVREIFHMDHFRIMVSYNPQEAKNDNTAVFQRYKEQYDLLEKTTPATTGAARKTRRAHVERRQTITSSISAPILPPLSPKDNRKHQKKVSDTSAIWDILATARDKGKSKQKDRGHEAIDWNETNGSDSFGDVAQDRPVESISAPIARKGGKANGTVLEKHGSYKRAICAAGESISTGAVRRTMKSRDSAEEPPLKRLRTRKQLLLTDSSSSIAHEPLVANKSRAIVQPTNIVPPAVVSKIKRIKLIVRRPPIQLSHPLQRAPLAKYDKSLSQFLSSFILLGGDNLNEAQLNAKASSEAATWEQAVKFRREGRFIPGTNVLFGAKPDDTEYVIPTRTSTDIWDVVLDAVAKERRIRSKRPSGKQVASQIASKIQAYWDGREARRDKVRLQEEKRLKTLAKATLKLVINDWKKAVFHIREQERLKQEAEELRRGHEHLDAILNQSGQILETQQLDLSRGEHYRSRSRSGSVSDHYGYADESEEDLEEDDGEEENEDEVDYLDLDDAVQDPESSLHDQDEIILHDAFEESESQAQDDEDQEVENETSQLLLGGGSSDHVSAEGNASPPTEDLIQAQLPTGSSSIRDTSVNHSTSPHHPVMPSLHALNLTEYDIGDSEPGSPAQSDNQSRRLSSPSVHSSSIKDSALPTTSNGTPVFDDGFEYPPEIEMDDESHQVTSASSPPATFLDAVDEVAEQPEHEVNEHPEELDDVESLADEDPASPIPAYLKPYAVAPVDWDPESKVTPPLLLRGVLRPYQQSGLEWLASLHTRNLNGILADEMGLGKTIQSISLLAHLACDRGIWGPHLIIVPTSVLLNWEMEFKKFLPGFKILSYHGSTKRRKELRQGWNDKYYFNVCITSYTLASRDAHIFKRKAWYYMILDEAHMIKNFRSQRWNILLMFRSFRRLLLTGTPLQNNLTELWALLQFLMSGANFADLKQFDVWFSTPLEKAIEMGNVMDEETLQRVSKLHTVLRPYLLRRLKRDVEKELPSKYEHLVLCPLSKRQRFLYDEFMSRAQTRDALESGIYQKIANILMQLRKVCNHPDLFEVRPIVTSFTMRRSAIADYEIKELLVRKRLFDNETDGVSLDLLGLRFIENQDTSIITALETRMLDETSKLPWVTETPGEPPPKDMRTIAGFREWSSYMQRSQKISHWLHIGYINRIRCNRFPVYSQECITKVRELHIPLVPLSAVDTRFKYMDTVYGINKAVKSYVERSRELEPLVDNFAFVTPAVVALDMPQIALPGLEDRFGDVPVGFDEILHKASVKLQIAFPDSWLLQYDCGKLQELTRLLREKKDGGHRVLIFTQMTRILDILEIFLNLHGYLYLRLDGATKIEDRQYITERFNADPRVFCFIASSRSGGVGINLTGADTVIFYDSDFNPQMDKQCEDRAHRIGQIRDVHIYRFVSQYTVEEAMLRKANQKRSLDDIVIQKGQFDWRSLFNDESMLSKALEEFEDTEDSRAAALAAREEFVMEGADEADFAGDVGDQGHAVVDSGAVGILGEEAQDGEGREEDHDYDAEGGTVVEYMLSFVRRDYEFFRDWRL